MTKLTLTLAAFATAAFVASALPAAAAQTDGRAVGVHSTSNIRLAQADVTVKRTVVKKKVIVKKPTVVVKKPAVVVRSPTVGSSTVVTTGRACKTVTVRKRVGSDVVVRKVRRCS